MKKLFAVLILVITSYAAGCIFSGNDEKSKSGAGALVGTWERLDQAHSLYTTFTFWSNGRFALTDYNVEEDGSHTSRYSSSGDYTVTGDELKLEYRNISTDYPDATRDFTFSISGNTLTLTGGGMLPGTKLVYNKV